MSSKNSADIFDWGPTLGKVIGRVAIGDIDGAAQELLGSDKSDTERPPPEPSGAIDLEPDGQGGYRTAAKVEPLAGEGCGKEWATKSGRLVCVEHKDGECVVERMRGR